MAINLTENEVTARYKTEQSSYFHQLPPRFVLPKPVSDSSGFLRTSPEMRPDDN